MKKTLPKLLCLVLVLALAVSFAGCGKDNKTNSSNGTVTEEPANTPSDVTTTDDPASKAVADYVAKNKGDLEEGFEKSFLQATGVNCKTNVYAEGTKLIVNIRFIGMNDIPEEAKQEILAAQTSDSYNNMLTNFQKIVPEITAVVFNLYEEDGDLIISF